MTEPTGILIALLVLGAGVVAAMLCLLRRGRTQHSPDGAWWLTGAAVGALLLLATMGLLDDKDERARITDIAITHCITSQADAKLIPGGGDRPAVSGCSRIDTRPLVAAK